MATQNDSAAQAAHEQSMKSKLYGVDISFTLLAVLAVIFRFWARYRSAGSYGWDDWLIIVSLFMVFVNFALNAVMIEHSLGLQAADVPLNSLITIGKGIYGDEIVYVVALATTKVAILVMYCRVFPLRRFKIGAWIVSTITVIWSLMFVFLCIFQCDPIPRAWNLMIPGKCLNIRALFIGNAVPNILTDVAILMMPTYHVWKLQVRTAQRVALTGIFLLGAFVIFASIYRFTTILELNPMNLSYTLKTPTTWSHIEVSVALISACLPTMRPLLTAFLGVIGMNSSKHDKSDSKSSGWSEHSAQGQRIAIPSKVKKSGKQGISDLTTFEILDDHESGTGGWSMPTKARSQHHDELPLNGISVQKAYEQQVVTSSKSDDGWDDHRRNSWYPA